MENNQQGYAPQPIPTPPSNPMAVASMILGIISLVALLFGVYAFLGIITGILGIVFAIMAKKQGPSGMATAGLVMSIIALALCAIVSIACYCIYSAAKEAIGGLNELAKFTVPNALISFFN